MSDRVFFPLICLLAAMMIIVALSPGEPPCEPTGPIGGANSDYTVITVEGCNLHRMIAGGEDALGLLERGGEKMLKIESYSGLQNDDPQRGPHFEIDSDLERAFSNHDIIITMTLRPSSQLGAKSFQAYYSVGRDGGSGWQTFDMFPDWKEYTFAYRVPEKKGANAFDYLGIRPIVPEDSRSIEIKRVQFRRIEKTQPGDGA